MANKCVKCKCNIEHDDFICPHCGTIIGDPVSYAGNVRSNAAKKHPFLKRPIFILGILILIAITCTIAWFLGTQDWHISETTAPNGSELSTHPSTTAPLAVYSVRIKNGQNRAIAGCAGHIYLDGQLLYSGVTDENGDISFILPQREGYYLSFTGLPVQYQVHYTDVYFHFSDGEQYQQIILEDKPVPYTVRVVNSAGEPVPDTAITFHSSGSDAQVQITDENGCCTFMANYMLGSCSAHVSFAPTGYVPGTAAGFGIDTLETTIELLTYEELGYTPENIYVVRVVDEYGAPISNIALYTTRKNSDGQIMYDISGLTNLDGCITCVSDSSVVWGDWEFKVLYNADYSDRVFTFDGSTHMMQIQLDLHKEPGTKYTYTISFLDFEEYPISGVEIGYQPPDSEEIQYYTSDENGIITFQTTTADPAEVKFRILYVPDGYNTNRPDDTLYSFPAYQRNTLVRLYYDRMIRYNIHTIDADGIPIANVQLWVFVNGKLRGEIVTDSNGEVTWLSPPGEITFAVVGMPSDRTEYAHYTVSSIEYGDRNQVYITIVPLL